MKLHGFVFALALVAVAAGPVHADRYFCIGAATEGDWDDDANWRSASGCTGDTGIPTDADKVTIPSGKTCNVDLATAEADRLVIESTATLNIEASNTLTLDGDGDDGFSTITGTIQLAGSSSELELVSNDQTFEGTGKIVGLDDAAKITLGSTVDLTSEITIEGIMHISGGGTFLNAGTVHANRDGTFHVNPNIIDDDPGALWKVTQVVGIPGGGASATLRYDQVSFMIGHTLVGDFEVTGGGTLDVDHTFDCTGKLTVSTGGTVDCSDELARFITP